MLPKYIQLIRHGTEKVSVFSIFLMTKLVYSWQVVFFISDELLTTLGQFPRNYKDLCEIPIPLSFNSLLSLCLSLCLFLFVSLTHQRHTFCRKVVWCDCPSSVALCVCLSFSLLSLPDTKLYSAVFPV